MLLEDPQVFRPCLARRRAPTSPQATAPQQQRGPASKTQGAKMQIPNQHKTESEEHGRKSDWISSACLGRGCTCSSSVLLLTLCFYVCSALKGNKV